MQESENRLKQANTTDPSGGKTTRPLINLLLVILFTGGSLWVADLAFRAYERAQLLPHLPEVSGTGAINLAALRYNDGLVERASAPGEFRILSFGDSFTYSVMEPRLSYNGVLQERLNAAVKDHRFRVINLGEPATGTRNFREAYDYWSEIFEHQGALFHIFLGNDIIDDAYLYGPVQWTPNESVIRGGNPILEAGSRRVPAKFPLRMFDYAYAWWMSLRTRSEQGLPEGYNWAGSTDFDENTFVAINFKYMENFDPRKLGSLSAGYEQVKHLLERAQEISTTGLPVAIAMGPAQTQVDEELRARVLAARQEDADRYDMELPQRIIRRLRDRFAPDVVLLDLTGAFREASANTGEKLYFRNNTHWDKAGNLLAGEVIANGLISAWFGGQGAIDREREAAGQAGLISDADIDAYLEPFTGDSDPDRPVISGAIRAIQMLDGIFGQADNWAIAPLNQPVLVQFGRPQLLRSLRLYLFDEDGRTYRYTVDVLRDGQWQRVSDHSEHAAGGMQEILLGVTPVTQLRITGLYNSSQAGNEANAFLHIEELEFVRTPGDQ